MMHPSRRLVARQSQSFTRKKREHTVFFWTIVVLATFSWVTVLSHLSYLKAFSISVIEISGVHQDIHSTVRAAANEAIRGDYINLFARSNILLYPEGEIIQAIENSSPRVEEVKVERQGRNSLFITIKEKEPAALVCANFPDFGEAHQLNMDKDECAFADNQAALYALAPTISGNMYNRYYVPALAEISTSSVARLGFQATTTAEFHALQEFYESLKKEGIEIKGILFKPNGEYEAYINNPAAKNLVDEESAATAVIYFNSARPFNVQLAHLLLFWTHALDDAKTKGKLPVYEYIDVRYGSNVFFREVSN
jgi:hypothetical protein